MSTPTPIRKTKIVATIGPACDETDTIEEMLRAGMNVARLNLSHGTLDEHRDRIGRIRVAAEQTGIPVAVMIDTRGVEIRTGRLQKPSVELLPESEFILYTDGRVGDWNGVSVSYQHLHQELNPGDHILLDDGAIELVVLSTGEREIHCRVVHGGILRENKSVNLPDTELAMSELSKEFHERSVLEMTFAAENDVDYIAASFIQNADDVNAMRDILNGLDRRIPIIAKIENRAGVEHLDAIVAAADGIMVARGDLGVELPLADVPAAQKRIIHKTVMNGRPVITATQMLASMEHNPKPTRAEASDVANAILDGTSAVMLSGETAMGEYPVEAVRTMAALAQRAEVSLREFGYLQKILPHPSNVVTEAVSQSAARMAEQLGARAIFSLTSTGFTSRLISKHRPDCPILAITGSCEVVRRLCMNWGVVPFLYEGGGDDEDRIAFAIRCAREKGLVAPGDVVIATAGYRQQAGGTDLIRVITLSPE